MKGACCPQLASYATHYCSVHGNSCPDQVIIKTAKGYGIPIHDGGSSYIEIQFCPWCGTKWDSKRRRARCYSSVAPMVPTQKIPAELLKELKRKSKYPDALESADRPTVEMPKAT